MEDDAVFCISCGARFDTYSAGANNQHNANVGQEAYRYGQGYAFPYDHTAEFNQQDIHNNKVICLAIYLMGAIGVIIAVLVSKESPFVSFHVRQALKITVLQTLTVLASGILCWTIVVPLAGIIFFVILFVVRIICFVRICGGRAIEPPIVRSFSFLN